MKINHKKPSIHFNKKEAKEILELLKKFPQEEGKISIFSHPKLGYFSFSYNKLIKGRVNKSQ